MKRLITVIAIALLCLLPNAVNAKTDNVIKILAIGNSFSEDAIEQHFHELAEAEGINVIVCNMFIGGCNLQRHLDNALNDKPVYSYRKIGLDGKKVVTKNVTLSFALADETWDYVSFQQQSGRSGLYETWSESLPALVDYVKPRLPREVVLMLHQTWAYDSTSTHKNFKFYNN